MKNTNELSEIYHELTNQIIKLLIIKCIQAVPNFAEQLINRSFLRLEELQKILKKLF